MKNVNYNGWTNYATWRVNLEIFDNVEIFADEWYGEINADLVRDYAEEVIFIDGNDDLIASYAYAFLNNVNWYEIAEHIKDTLTEINDYKNSKKCN